MKKEERSLSAVLAETVGKNTEESYFSMIAIAYSLFLGQRKVPDVLNTIVRGLCPGRAEKDVVVRNFLIKYAEPYWKEYCHKWNDFGTEDLKRFILETKSNSVEIACNSVPETVMTLAASVLDIGEKEVVADFGCGTGDFLKYVSEKNLCTEICGFETNENLSAVAKIRTNVQGKKIQIENDDIFLEQTNSDGSKKYDKIFCYPPFGVRLGRMTTALSYVSKYEDIGCKFAVRNSCTAEWAFVLKVLSSLKEAGKGVILMSQNGLSGQLDNPFRQYLLKHKKIEAVIQLPERCMNFMQIAPYMVVVSHKQNEKVHMIDASRMCMVQRRNNILRMSDIEEILALLKQNDEAAHQKITDYRDMIVSGNMKPQFYLTEDLFADEMTCFEDIIRKVKRGKLFSAKTLDEISVKDKAPGKVQYLTHSNLKDRLIEDNLITLANPGEKDLAYAVEPGDLILSKIGDPFKIAIQEKDDDRTLIASGNLFIVSLKTDLADSYYVKAFLESEKGQNLLNRIANGSVMPNLSMEALKKMKISLPALNIQRKIGEKYHEELKNCIRLKRELAESMIRLNEIINQ